MSLLGKVPSGSRIISMPSGRADIKLFLALCYRCIYILQSLKMILIIFKSMMTCGLGIRRCYLRGYYPCEKWQFFFWLKTELRRSVRAEHLMMMMMKDSIK